MLDRSKIYAGYSIHRDNLPATYNGRQPCAKFKRVKILYEDGISFYVASLTKNDAGGHPVHYSVKKHVFQLIEINTDMTPECCKICPLHKAAVKMGLGEKNVG